MNNVDPSNIGTLARQLARTAAKLDGMSVMAETNADAQRYGNRAGIADEVADEVHARMIG